MLPKPVLTKKDFVRRYQMNEFGNRSPTWNPDNWMRYAVTSGFAEDSLYHLRNQIAGGDTFYNLTVNMLARKLNSIPKEDWSDYYVSRMAPTEHTLIQGEVQRTAAGLYLRYTRVRKPMRDALATHQDHAWGLTAKSLLKQYLDPRSYEWLEHLLDSYPDHVIEFSTYGVNFGTIPGVNTVWWEIRKY